MKRVRFGMKLLVLALALSLVVGAPASAEAPTYKGYAVVPVALNGQLIPLSIPAINLDGTSMIPLRAFSEAVGARVEWDPTTQSVNLVPNAATGTGTASTKELSDALQAKSLALDQANARIWMLQTDVDTLRKLTTPQSHSQTYSDGSTFSGFLLNGEFHGRGTYTWPVGDKYVGNYRYGDSHGQGTYTWANRDQYTGDWIADSRTGKGTYTWADGRKYVGEFKDGRLWGQGTWTHPDGRKYVGEFRDDGFHGQGTWTNPDGRKYVGGFKDGAFHGKGTFTWPEGHQYTGDWVDGVRTGHGTFTWQDGDVYTGDFVAGDRTGLGVYQWPTGDRYIGEFVEGKREGLGTHQGAGGTIYAGIWVANELAVVGSATSPAAGAAPAQATSALTVEEIFAQLSASVFRVDVYDAKGNLLGTGSAVAVGASEVVTNYHVIEEAVSARLVDDSGKAYVVLGMTAANVQQDLAVLRVRAALKAVDLRTTTVKVGEEVVTIGSPIGLTNTVSTGIVSALRTLPGLELLQTSAPISPGSSGGGMFDRQGKLIGITSMGILEGENLGFAIPTKYVKTLVDLGKISPVRKLPGSQ